MTVPVAAPMPWMGAPWSPRRWQAEALPLALDAIRARKRPIISAIMGAGKSKLIAEVVALALPRSAGRAVIVATPTQALVEQLAATIAERVGAHRVGRYYGAAKQPGADVVVACFPSLVSWYGASGGKKVSLLIVDEAHKSESDTVRDAVGLLAPASQLGLTATPYRSEACESLTLWDCVAYRYGMPDALRDGVLVPPRWVLWDGDATDLDEVCATMIERSAPPGPGLVNARTIEDAEQYARYLSARGIPAAAIDGTASHRARSAVLRRLELGELRAVVHVDLLAEGVDLPWIRWMCLRRPVGARVRFLQELGRGLRAHPGKAECVMLDPLWLSGIHRLEHPEAIGEALEREQGQAVERTGQAGAPEEVEAVRVDALTRYLRGLAMALAMAGIIPEEEVHGHAWRLSEPSPKQSAALDRVSRLTRHIPLPHRATVRQILDHRAGMTRGMASDMLSILVGGARWCREESERRGVEAYRISWPVSAVAVDPP